MDHLSSVRNAQHSALEVPLYMNHKRIYRGPVHEYLHYREGNESADVDLCSDEKTEDQIYATMQEWFFFGLLRETFKDAFSANEFICTLSDGSKGISTVELPQMMSEWIRSEQELSEEEKDNR